VCLGAEIGCHLPLYTKLVIDPGNALHFGSVEWHARILAAYIKAGHQELFHETIDDRVGINAGVGACGWPAGLQQLG
jgi:hypothetical protein